MAGEMLACTLRLDGQRVYVTERASLMWLSCVRNTDGVELVRVHEDILRIAKACGRFVTEPPPWWNDPPESREHDGFVMFGPDICMPVVEGAATTTVVRGSLSPERMAARRYQRQGRRAWKRAHRKARGWSWGKKLDGDNAVTISGPEQQEA